MRRHGVALGEVVVAFVMFATMLGVAVPALREVRDVAKDRQTTLNHLKHCVLAIHNYHDTYRRLPDAFAPGGAFPNDAKSIWFHLLPYVEADRAYKNNDPLALVTAYQAPLDPSGEAPGRVSFAVNLRIAGYSTIGAANVNKTGGAVQVPAAGAVVQALLTLPRIVDGTSNVFMLATRYSVCGNTTTFYAAAPADHGGFFGAGAHSRKPGANREDADLMFQVAPIARGQEAASCNPQPGVYGHSFTHEGLFTALADGTVKVIRPTMSAVTFTRALSPGDQQVLLADWVE